jgi:hypothetical protein
MLTIDNNRTASAQQNEFYPLDLCPHDIMLDAKQFSTFQLVDPDNFPNYCLEPFHRC